MRNRPTPIPHVKYDRIKDRISNLKKREKGDLINLARQSSRLDLGNLKGMSKTDLVYMVLNREYSTGELLAFENKLFSD